MTSVMSDHRTRATALVLGVCSTILGCATGDPAQEPDGEAMVVDGGEESSTDDGAGEDSAEDSTIPLDIDYADMQARCVALDTVPLQSSVAPEGQLWLRMDDRTWRVLDPLGYDETQQLPATLGSLYARDEQRALVIDEEGLWDLQAGWMEPLAWPGEHPVPSSLCGDPTSDANGFVVAEGLLHRDGGLWWEWTDPAGNPWSDTTWMASNAGGCRDRDGALWLSDGDGRAWRVDDEYAARVEDLDHVQEAVLLDGTGVAAHRDGVLILGEQGDFERVHFEAGPVSSISAGGEALWVLTGDRLHRRIDGRFEAITIDGELARPDAVHAEASGGAWISFPDEVCHLRTTPPLHIDGLFGLQRVTRPTLELSFRSSVDTDSLTAMMDDVELAVEAVEPGRWRAVPISPSPGWHQLEVASGDAESERRHMTFEQRSAGQRTWTRDIEPLFEAHCSGAACHGSDTSHTTRPDLSTWQAWIEREDAIVERVVDRGDMPPASATDDSWGLEQRLLISEWFDAGAPQQEEE